MFLLAAGTASDHIQLLSSVELVTLWRCSNRSGLSIKPTNSFRILAKQIQKAANSPIPKKTQSLIYNLPTLGIKEQQGSPASSLLDDKLLAGSNMSPYVDPKCQAMSWKKATSLGQNAKRQHCGCLMPRHVYKVCMFIFYNMATMATTQSNCAANTPGFSTRPTVFPFFRLQFQLSWQFQLCSWCRCCSEWMKKWWVQQLRKFFTNRRGWLFHTTICKSSQDTIITSHQNPKILTIPDSRG